MTELVDSIVSNIVETPTLSEARQDCLDMGLTPLSPIASEAVTMVTSLIGVKTAAVVSHSGAVAALSIAHGMPDGGVVTLVNPQPELVDHARQRYGEEKPAGVLLRPITGLPLDVMSRLADGAYDLVSSRMSPISLVFLSRPQPASCALAEFCCCLIHWQMVASWNRWTRQRQLTPPTMRRLQPLLWLICWPRQKTSRFSVFPSMRV